MYSMEASFFFDERLSYKNLGVLVLCFAEFVIREGCNKNSMAVKRYSSYPMDELTLQQKAVSVQNGLSKLD